ncbi:SDR family NAD(P)-dependent oxidoreductase [Frankia sp. Cpl3]|nr:SDR family NAD(P)-dependent oxidoreductase [Frankia sp. Cpl3]
MTAPSGRAQERVVRAALVDAGVGPGEVDVVEGHGTGTRLGDPIELGALLTVFGGRSGDSLLVGSVKSNIGHTQAAAGVAGVIKMVEGLRRGAVAGSLHVDAPTSRVDWSSGGVEVARETVPWPGGPGRVRRAGVSSFGISGTNAHVILEQAGPGVDRSGARELPAGSGPGTDPAVVPWFVSARSAAALRAQAARLAAHLTAGAQRAAESAESVLDIGFSLATGRAALPCRAAVAAADRDGASRALAALARGESAPTLVEATVGTPGRTAMLFTGQGSQRVGMGRELRARFPVFAEIHDRVRSHLDPLLERPLDEADGDADLLDRTDLTQPALFALQVALHGLLRSWGVVPDVVAGHSVGEIAAAHVAGVLSLPDACRLVAARGRLMAAQPGGAMLAIQATEREVRGWLPDTAGLDVAGELDVAAVNGPESVVVSGTERAVAALAAHAERAGRRTRRLRVTAAFHSPLMDGMLEPFRQVAATLTYHAPAIPLVSTVTGRAVAAGELCDADYWVRQARAAVRFADAVTCLRERGVTTFVEVGPAAVLSGMGRECVPAGDAAFVPTLRADRPEEHTLVTALSQAHVNGVHVDWAAFFAGTGAHRVDLPTYAFQHRRYWFQPPPASGATDPATAGGAGGASDSSGTDDLTYRIVWTPVSLPGAATPALSGTWIVVLPPPAADAAPLARACVQALELHGAQVRQLALDEADVDRAPLAGRLAAALTDAADRAQDVRGVLSLAALDDSPLRTHPVLPTGLAGTVALLQALGDAGVDAPLWCATRGAVSTGPGDPLTNPAQAQVWGLGRVAALEMPARWGGLVDLPATLDPRTSERLVAVLAATSGEDQVALRPAGTFARRLVRAGTTTTGGRPGTEEAGGAPWRPRGTVLITGGTGALGAAIAQWCAAEGAERLVLTSRRGAAAPGAAELVAELSSLGVQTTVAACDVADRAALARVLADIPAEHPVTAVVHAAGSGTGGVLERVGPAELADVVAAKTAGAAHLDELLSGHELDAFVLFASVAGIWGNPGQGAYAAANAGLDALAEHRRARGLPATSVAWGPWAGGGMADVARVRERTARHGLPALDPPEALRALAEVVGHGESCVAVVRVAWERFVAAFPPGRPTRFVDEIPPARDALARLRGDGTASGVTGLAPGAADQANPRPDVDGTNAANGPGNGGSSAGQLRERLAALPDSGRHRLLLGLVRTEVAAVLGHASPEDVPADRAFTDLGFDSLASVETRNRLAQATGEQLAAVVVFDHPTPAALARHLLSVLRPDETGPEGGLLPGPGSGAEAGAGSVLDDLDRLQAALAASPPDGQVRSALQTRLRTMLRTLDAPDDDLGAATDEEMFDLLGREFGIS